MSALSLLGPIESFNVRLLELLKFNNIKIFFKVFKKTSRVSNPEKKLCNAIENTIFVDGLMMRYLIIYASLLQGYEFLLASNNSWDSKQPLLNLF